MHVRSWLSQKHSSTPTSPSCPERAFSITIKNLMSKSFFSIFTSKIFIATQKARKPLTHLNWTCGRGKCPDMWAGQMSGHVGRANVRTCGQGQCPDMWAGQMSGHVGRVNVRTCGQGKRPDMWAG